MYGKRIREIRMKRGFTQQKTADSLNITLRSYQRYEGEHCEPPLSTLVAIADLFDVSADFILCRDDWMTSHGVSSDEYL